MHYLVEKYFTSSQTDMVEKWIKKLMDRGVKIQDGFVLPGSTPDGADIHIARTVCRRVERLVVRFMVENEHRFDLKYLSILLNRLSDFLFTQALVIEEIK